MKNCVVEIYYTNRMNLESRVAWAPELRASVFRAPCSMHPCSMLRAPWLHAPCSMLHAPCSRAHLLLAICSRARVLPCSRARCSMLRARVLACSRARVLLARCSMLRAPWLHGSMRAWLMRARSLCVARCFYTTFLHCKAFLHCVHLRLRGSFFGVFALCGGFWLRFCAARRFLVAC